MHLSCWFYWALPGVDFVSTPLVPLTPTSLPSFLWLPFIPMEKGKVLHLGALLGGDKICPLPYHFVHVDTNT